ncbi:MAG: acetyl-CoA C-acyltransferase [Deltaproteobacteria bacterium]|nr:acetyl-CoA C-acyltransferase [Deltaproteobacteria bacterium]
MSPRPAFIVDAVRSPIGRLGGALAQVRPDDLAAAVIRALVTRTEVEPVAIDDVIFGCTNQAGEDNRNVARMAVLLAGLPVEVPGITVNRLCASGMQAVADAARLIGSGEADIIIAGGVESMSRAPLVLPKAQEGYARGDVTAYDTMLGWRMINPRMQVLHGTDALGETAEHVAELHQISRAAQDAFALQSQQNCLAAQRAGRFENEIVPIEIAQKKGAPRVVTQDEHPRGDITLDALSRLSPVFRKNGTITAGNASGINDGASALMLASKEGLERIGRARFSEVRVVGSAVAGVEPRKMGLGPIPATQKLLARLGLAARDLDLIELNEAFAAQCLPCIDALALDPERVNVNGGAIALGHPLGCSGARITTTLVHELVRRDARRGLATMCIGVGQGMSLLIERG